MRSGLLVASPQMVDVFFSKTVVLLCDYDEEGALGVVVNRLTGLDADKVLLQMGVHDGGGLEGPVHWGGPVQPGAVFMTFTRPAAGESSLDEAVFEIAGGIAVSPSRDMIQAVAGNADGGKAFLSLGYAGWAAAQLDAEIESGSWIFMDADEDILFDTPPDERWQKCIDSIGVDPAMIWMKPVSE